MPLPSAAEQDLMDQYNRALKAIEAGDIKSLAEWAKTDPGFPNSPMPYIESRWFSEALLCGSIETITWMIAQGAEINFEDDEGYGAICRACQRDGDDIEAVIDLLVGFGANVSQPDCLGYTPLHDAAAARNLRVVQKLIDVGADLTAICRDGRNKTPLQFAKCFRKNRPVIAALKVASLAKGSSGDRDN